MKVPLRRQKVTIFLCQIPQEMKLAGFGESAITLEEPANSEPSRAELRGTCQFSFQVNLPEIKTAVIGGMARVEANLPEV